LCVHEAASRHAQSHLRRFAPVVWWGSLVEVHSAICRLHRDEELSDLDKQGAVTRLRLLNRGWREILPDDQVRDLATQLLDTHSLRAADSLQLAASLELVRTASVQKELHLRATGDWPRLQNPLDSRFSNFQESVPERNMAPCL
jgi:predicted nucleic acid-binding protein